MRSWFVKKSQEVVWKRAKKKKKRKWANHVSSFANARRTNHSNKRTEALHKTFKPSTRIFVAKTPINTILPSIILPDLYYSNVCEQLNLSNMITMFWTWCFECETRREKKKKKKRNVYCTPQEKQIHQVTSPLMLTIVGDVSIRWPKSTSTEPGQRQHATETTTVWRSGVLPVSHCNTATMIVW